MTAKEMIDVMLKLPAGCRITFDSGWECGETGICEVWYSATENEARLTQGHYPGETIGFCLMWRGEDKDGEADG